MSSFSTPDSMSSCLERLSLAFCFLVEGIEENKHNNNELTEQTKIYMIGE